MKIVRDETGAGALNLVRAGFQRLAGKSLRNHRRIFRLNGDGLERGLRGLMTSTHRDRAARADRRDEDVDSPSVSSQISSAVVLRWIAGLAGLLNCCGIQAFGVLRTTLRRWRWRLSCLRARSENQLCPQHREQGAALERHRFGHRQDQLVTFAPRRRRRARCRCCRWSARR